MHLFRSTWLHVAGRWFQLVQQRLRLQQILGVEAFGEPAVDRGEQLIRVLAFALALPQPCEAGRRAQLPHFRLLAARPVERGEKVPFGTFKVALEREHPALEAQDLGVVKAFLPPGAFDLGDLLVDQLQGIVEVAGQRHGFGQERFHGRAADLAAARFPNRDAGLERGNSFGGFAFPDQCQAVSNGCQHRPQHGQAVLPTQPLTFFGALAQVLVRQAVIELMRPNSQRKSEVEGVTAPAGVRVFFIV